MADIDHLIQKIADSGAKIDLAAVDVKNAVDDAEKVLATAEALGAEPVIDTLDQIIEQLNDLAADLKTASDQMDTAQALAKKVRAGQGSGSSGPLRVPNASSDPAGVPSDRPAPAKSRGRRIAETSARKVEDIQDATDALQNGFNAADDPMGLGTPPPEAVSTSTQTPSGSSASQAAPAIGVEASTMVGALLGVAVGVLGSREYWRRARRKKE